MGPEGGGLVVSRRSSGTDGRPGKPGLSGDGDGRATDH